MDYETLRYEQDDHVTVLTYDRPEQHNAVTREMNAELHHAWQRFRDDDEAFVLVITGAGRRRSAPAGTCRRRAREPGDYDAFRIEPATTRPGECGYARKADVFKPVIAAVNGYAFAPASRPRCWPTSGSSPRTRSSARSSGAGTSSAATA